MDKTINNNPKKTANDSTTNKIRDNRAKTPPFRKPTPPPPPKPQK